MHVILLCKLELYKGPYLVKPSTIFCDQIYTIVTKLSFLFCILFNIFFMDIHGEYFFHSDIHLFTMEFTSLWFFAKNKNIIH